MLHCTQLNVLSDRPNTGTPSSCLREEAKQQYCRFRACGDSLARGSVWQCQALLLSLLNAPVFSHPLTSPLPSLSPLLTPTSTPYVRWSAVDNEAALSVTPVAFHNRNGESFIAVGTAKGLTFHPRSHEGCFVHMYR